MGEDDNITKLQVGIGADLSQLKADLDAAEEKIANLGKSKDGKPIKIEVTPDIEAESFIAKIQKAVAGQTVKVRVDASEVTKVMKDTEGASSIPVISPEIDISDAMDKLAIFEERIKRLKEIGEATDIATQVTVDPISKKATGGVLTYTDALGRAQKETYKLVDVLNEAGEVASRELQPVGVTLSDNTTKAARFREGLVSAKNALDSFAIKNADIGDQIGLDELQTKLAALGESTNVEVVAIQQFKNELGAAKVKVEEIRAAQKAQADAQKQAAQEQAALERQQQAEERARADAQKQAAREQAALERQQQAEERAQAAAQRQATQEQAALDRQRHAEERAATQEQMAYERAISQLRSIPHSSYRREQEQILGVLKEQLSVINRRVAAETKSSTGNKQVIRALQLQKATLETTAHTARLSVYARDVANRIEKARNNMAGMQGYARSTANIFKGIVLSQAFYKSLNAIKGIVSEAWDLSVTLNSTEAAFSGMLVGGQQKAEALLEVLKQEAINTPFDIKNLTEAARLLTAYGIQAENLMYVMKAVEQATAASGDASKMDRISLALGQIYTKGRLVGEEVRQLTEAGIAVSEILTEELGLTREDLKKGWAALSIDANTAINAIVRGIDKRYGQALDNMAKTTRQKINNMRESFALITSSLTDPIRRAIDTIIDTVTPRVEQLYQAIQAIGLGNALKTLVPERVLNAAVTAINGVVRAVQGIKIAFQQAKPIITAVMNSLAWAGGVVYDIFMSVLAVMGMFGNALSSSASGAATLEAVLKRLFGAIIAVRMAMLAFSAVSKVLGIFLPIMRGIRLAIQGVGISIRALATIMSNAGIASAAGWLPVIGVLLTIIGLVATLAGKLASIKGAAKRVGEALKNMGGGTTFSDMFKDMSGDLQTQIDAYNAQVAKQNAEMNNALIENSDSQTEDADAAAGATKKAMQGLMSFDEVYKLMESSAGGGGETPIAIEIEPAATVDMGGIWDNFGGLGDDWLADLSFDDLQDALGDLWGEISPLLDTVLLYAAKMVGYFSEMHLKAKLMTGENEEQWTLEKSQTSEDSEQKRQEELQTSQDTEQKRQEELQTSQDTEQKRQEELQTAQDTEQKRQEELQTAQDIEQKRQEELQTAQDTEQKRQEELQTAQDTEQKRQEELQTAQDTEQKRQEELQTAQDTEQKRQEELQTAQDIEQKRQEELQTAQDTEQKRQEELQTAQDTEQKRQEELQTAQDTEQKRQEELQTAQDIEQKRQEELQTLQDIEQKRQEELQTAENKEQTAQEKLQTAEDKEQYTLTKTGGVGAGGTGVAGTAAALALINVAQIGASAQLLVDDFKAVSDSSATLSDWLALFVDGLMMAVDVLQLMAAFKLIFGGAGTAATVAGGAAKVGGAIAGGSAAGGAKAAGSAGVGLGAKAAADAGVGAGAAAGIGSLGAFAGFLALPIAAGAAVLYLGDTLESVGKNINDFNKDHKKSVGVGEQVRETIQEEADQAKALTAEYATLASQDELTVAGRDRMKSIAQKLVDIYPELNNYVDQETGLLGLSATSMNDYVDAAEQRASIDFLSDDKLRLLEEERQLVGLLKAAEAEEDEARAKYAASGSRWDKLTLDSKTQHTDEIRKLLDRNRVDLKNNEIEHSKYADAIESYEASIGESVEDRMQKEAEALTKQQDAYHKYYQDFEKKASEHQTRLNTLSADGYAQQNLTMDGWLKGMTERQRQEYERQENLAKLKGRDIPAAMIKELEDAGPGYGKLIEELANSNDEKLQEVVDVWEGNARTAKELALEELGPLPEDARLLLERYKTATDEELEKIVDSYATQHGLSRQEAIAELSGLPVESEEIIKDSVTYAKTTGAADMRQAYGDLGDEGVKGFNAKKASVNTAFKGTLNTLIGSMNVFSGRTRTALNNLLSNFQKSMNNMSVSTQGKVSYTPVTSPRMQLMAEGGAIQRAASGIQLLRKPTMLAPNVVGGEAGTEIVFPLQNTRFIQSFAADIARAVNSYDVQQATQIMNTQIAQARSGAAQTALNGPSAKDISNEIRSWFTPQMQSLHDALEQDRIVDIQVPNTSNALWRSVLSELKAVNASAGARGLQLM